MTRSRETRSSPFPQVQDGKEALAKSNLLLVLGYLVTLEGVHSWYIWHLQSTFLGLC